MADDSSTQEIEKDAAAWARVYVRIRKFFSWVLPVVTWARNSLLVVAPLSLAIGWGGGSSVAGNSGRGKLRAKMDSTLTLVRLIASRQDEFLIEQMEVRGIQEEMDGYEKAKRKYKSAREKWLKQKQKYDPKPSITGAAHDSGKIVRAQ